MSSHYPPHPYLSAAVKGSFAYKTVKDRMPIIVTKVIDFLCRNKKCIENDSQSESVKVIIGKLSKLRSEMQTNKPLHPLTTSSHLGDNHVWNEQLQEQTFENGSSRWFSSPWLLVECYMYRVIYAAFEESIHLKELDPFRHLKEEAFSKHKCVIEQLACYTNEASLLNNPSFSNVQENFKKMIEVCLWGNRNDLSLSAGDSDIKLSNFMEDIQHLNSHILVNRTNEIWLHIENIQNSEGRRELSIIMDNAGLEVVTDLCLAVYCISQKLFDQINFHVKKIPWFVSDTTFHDLHWILLEMRNGSADLQRLAESCLGYLNSKQFQIVEEGYWTLPLPFYVMPVQDPKLYERLTKSKLIIFKGDLNYRKLGSDISWPCATTFQTFLQGFNPAPLVALRTVKAEIISELPLSKAEELRETDPDWMEKGVYGLIQFAP